MKTCEAVREDVSAWLDGELEQERETEMLAHTEACEEGRSFLETCRLMSEDLRLEVSPVPETLIPGVMRRLSEERQTVMPGTGTGRTNDRRKLYRRVAVWACAAACLALIVFAGPWNWRAGSAGSKADMYAEDSAASAAAEPKEAPAETGTESAAADGWADSAKSAAYDESMYDAEYAEAAEEETAANAVLPDGEATDDFVPRAEGAGQFLGDYAAVITVYGEVPEGVLALSEREELLPDGVAWLIPLEMADELSAALEESGTAWEWLPGDEETSSWLLVRAGEN